MRKLWFLVLLVCLLAIIACSQPAATPAPLAQAPTLAPTAAPTATPRPTDPPPTATAALTATPTAVPPTAAPTQTAASTATPSPSPTPAPAASVTGDSVNVRGGPGTVYPIVGQAKQGEALPVVSRTQDGAWLEVTLANGKQGWVSAKLVALNVPAETLAVAKAIPPTPLPKPTTAPALQSEIPTGTIIGRVLGRGGDARAGERVYVAAVIVGEEGVRDFETYTGTDGRFVLANVPACSYCLLMLYVGQHGHAQLCSVNGELAFEIAAGQTLDVANINVPW